MDGEEDACSDDRYDSQLSYTAEGLFILPMFVEANGLLPPMYMTARLLRSLGWLTASRIQHLTTSCEETQLPYNEECSDEGRRQPIE